MQTKALWAFLAAGVGAGATTVGALLVSSHNRRTLAFQEDAEKRREALQEDVEKRREASETAASERLALDTVVSALKLIASEAGYMPKASIIGGLTTLVQLGHPILAMQVAETAVDDDAVRAGMLMEILSEVFLMTSDPENELAVRYAQEAAASFLHRRARQLTDDQHPGVFSWPVPFLTAWPTGLSANASVNVMWALINLLLPKPKSWWHQNGNTHSWVVYTFDEALRVEGAQSMPGQVAATLGQLVIQVTDEDDYVGTHDFRHRRDVLARMAPASKWDTPEVDRYRAELARWKDPEPIRT